MVIAPCWVNIFLLSLPTHYAQALFPPSLSEVRDPMSCPHFQRLGLGHHHPSGSTLRLGLALHLLTWEVIPGKTWWGAD